MALVVVPVISPAKSSPCKNLRTIPSAIIHRCKTVGDLRQAQALLFKSGSFSTESVIELFLNHSAITLARPAMIAYALDVLRCHPSPQAEAYNILIRAFVKSHSPYNALLLFDEMLQSSLALPDPHTFSCVLKACSRNRSLHEGMQIHGQVLKLELLDDEFVVNSLIHMYASCGNVAAARQLFDGMANKGTVTWNAMFAGYFKGGDWSEVVELFRYMLHHGAEFDEVTLISVLTACGRLGELELGDWIFKYAERNGLLDRRNLVTCLVDMYAKCGHVDKARMLFDEMPCRDVVAWSAMISGYTQSSKCREALTLFNQMQMASVDPNEVTMVSVLSSCAVLGALETGKWVHSYIRRKRMRLTVNLGTALMDFYAKCGCIQNSLDVFEKMPSKNAWSYSVVIQGLANHGQGREALKYFNLMLEAGLSPNDITFIGVLSACSHAGLVVEGRHYFDGMTQHYGVEPKIEHYGCMVDILGRAGLINEALQFINQMPIKPNVVIWRTLLASCKTHKNIEVGEESLKQLQKLDSKHSGDYILLSNIYASSGRKEDAMKVRNEMREKQIKKVPGCSLIELGGAIHEFFAEDVDHPESKEIYNKLEEVITKIKLLGYKANVAEARLDAEEDEKEVSVAHHSEKLAIAYGLLRSPQEAPIHICKNLRVCMDCHSATKLISKAYRKEIIVRDRNRFHHFRDGSCSCNDYW